MKDEKQIILKCKGNQGEKLLSILFWVRDREAKLIFLGKQKITTFNSLNWYIYSKFLNAKLSRVYPFTYKCHDETALGWSEVHSEL